MTDGQTAQHPRYSERKETHRKIGELLLEQGKLRRDQLEHALEMQKTMGGLIGSVLVELGLISDSDLCETLARSLGLELIDLNRLGAVDPDAAHFIPESIARRHKLIGVRFDRSKPERKTPDRVVVAMSDPSDFMALDSIRAATNMEPLPAVATRGQISDALQTAYLESPLSLEEAVGELKDFKVETPSDKIEGDDFNRLKSEAGLAPVVRFVNSMLFEAARMKASDIHIEPQEHHLRCRFRIDGELRVVAPPPKELQAAIISRIKIISALDIAERRLPQDGRLKIRFLGRNIDVRVSTMPTVHGEKVVLRLLDQSATTLNLDDLGFEEETVAAMRRIIQSPHGIVLLCGPTGCGKSTTLYSFVRELNQTNVNIVTVEDPVEYRIEGVNQTHVRPQIGLTFANCLRTILRQDPDIVMVGEIRDLETLEVAVRASLTGHLVFSTLHTNTAVSSTTRMVNMGLQPYLIAATLNAALSQRLVRKVCKACGKQVTLQPLAREALGRCLGQEVDFEVVQKVGCPECGYTGYKGRVAVNELFEPNDAIRELIGHGAEEQAVEAAAKAAGMKFLIDNAWRKLKAGVTTVEEVLSLGFQRAEDAAALTREKQKGGSEELIFDDDDKPTGETLDFDANPPG
ncbi:MAG: Flp pilus assembly complex ATPase component TadA [Planctomycetes bacterium]|nr:Flp pilus assembly complex ATPase component TadA [Planctomycetota bacterium]